jgi:hypothetical protein
VRAPEPPLRTLVLGSCVTRDTFARLPADRFALVDYVARQSLLAADRPSPAAAALAPRVRVPSRFRRRMALGTLAADLHTRIDAARDRVDLVLWDLADERLGVYELPDGGLVTRTVELLECGLDAELATRARHLPFGSEEHLARWAGAAERMRDRLAAARLDDRTVLLELPWAERSADGELAPTSFGTSARTFNSLAAPYYRFVRRRLEPVRVLRPPVAPLSGPTNVWGEAPFHYAEPVYTAVADALVARTDDPEHGLPVPRPQVEQVAPLRVVVTTARTWGETFALRVTRRGEVVTERAHQRGTRFEVALDTPGRYGFRVHHRRAVPRRVESAGLTVSVS